MVPSSRRLFSRSTWTDAQYVASLLRSETLGGLLMLAAAVFALVWANVSPDSYQSVMTTTIGPSQFHLDLDLATWAADGLLAVFFFVAGLELKRELVVGSLRRPAEAVLPIVAAVSGMVAPIAIYLAVNTVIDGGDSAGWAVPTATDIAFALAVLAVIGSRLPSALRAFLLTLAVVDDLLAIVIIAVFFTDDLRVAPLAASASILAGYVVLQRRWPRSWWLYLPMAVVAWALMHESGVHATVVGVAFGLLTRARHRGGESESPAEELEHRVRPFSAAVCVPLFALSAAGVQLSGELMGDVFTEPVMLGVVLGLVVGKLVGIFSGTYLTARFTRAELSDDLEWSDVLGLGALAGIGFTVSLLIGELAFAGDEALVDSVKVAVLIASLIAAVLAAVVLGRRNALYRRIAELESIDQDLDGVPDVFTADVDEP
jgi:NhaA family Na+:H+ antiporter